MRRAGSARVCTALRVVALACSVSACASVNPSLVPTRVLAPGRVVVDVGSAYAAPVVAQDLSRAVESSRALSSGSTSESDRTAVIQGAAAFGNTPPGIASVAMARVGLPERVEAHVALLGGRVFRAGARRVFWTDREALYALSLGAQLRGAVYSGPLDGTVPGLTVPEGRLAGGDVYGAFGRTFRELYDVWVGLRAGYTYGNARLVHPAIDMGTAFGADLHRIDAAMTLGLRVGFGRISATAELETGVGYYWLGTGNGVNAQGAVLTLVPAASLGYSF